MRFKLVLIRKCDVDGCDRLPTYYYEVVGPVSYSGELVFDSALTLRDGESLRLCGDHAWRLQAEMMNRPLIDYTYD